MQTPLFFRAVCILSVLMLTQCTQPTPTQPNEDAIRQHLRTSRWYLDTTRGYYQEYLLCTSASIISIRTLDFISPTQVLREYRNGTTEVQDWLLHQPSYYLRGKLELQIGGNKFPITYCTRDTLILGTPWLDADCNGFRMLAKAK
jgi:hypothetical protein